MVYMSGNRELGSVCHMIFNHLKSILARLPQNQDNLPIFFISFNIWKVLDKRSHCLLVSLSCINWQCTSMININLLEHYTMHWHAGLALLPPNSEIH